MFVSQFLVILSHQDTTLLIKYIEMDKDCPEFEYHLSTIFAYLRNQAVHAIKSCDFISLNLYTTHLTNILKHPDGCNVFYKTQKILNFTDPRAVLIHYAEDYLAPFFGLHPADYITMSQVIHMDVSTIPAINAARAQYTDMMKNVENTSVVTTDCSD